MEVQEMRDIVQTLKHSEQSANEEKQYRETITNADKNCEDVMQLLSKSKKEINYNLRSKQFIQPINNTEILIYHIR